MNSPTDLETIKMKMKTMWMAGDYGTFAKFMEPEALEILAGWEIPPGTRMLDVGCGAGQIAIPAARMGVQVTGIDIASNLIEQARDRATCEGVQAHFEEGDIEQLVFPDGSFDVVVSLIGAMFAPRPEKVATELLRVCRPGGRIIMANWTPTHFPGQMFKTIGTYIPPAPNVPPPPLWGNEDTVRERLGHGLSSLTMNHRFYPSWHYPFSVPEVVEYFRQFFGPINRAFLTVQEDQQPSLRKDLEEVFSQFNRAEDGTTSLEGEYLEVIGIKK